MTRRTTLALAVAVAVVGAGALIVSLLSRDPGPPPLRERQLSAEAFLDSIGVNVHFTYTDTAYVRRDELLARLREVGIRHVRDAMPSPVDSPLGLGLGAAADQGIRATLLPHDPTSDPGPLIADSLTVLGESVAAFEAPNEPDNSGDPEWAAKLFSYMPLLQQRIEQLAPGVPMIGPSLVHAASRLQVQARLPGIFNAHPYSGGGPPEPALGEAVREVARMERGGRERGLVFTEVGYHNALAEPDGQPPVSEEAAAVYMPRLLMTAFGAGVRRTFLYELVDEKPEPALVDQEQHFGLLRNDLSPKPAFTAIKTLVAALRASPGEGTADRVPWSIVLNEPGHVERLMLKRRDGSRVIALWRPVSVWDEDARSPVDPGAQSVEVSFGGWEASDVSVWRPSVATAPVQRHDRANRVRLDLTGDLVLVSFR